MKTEFIVNNMDVIEKLENVVVSGDFKKIWDIDDFSYFLAKEEHKITFFSNFTGFYPVYYYVNNGKLSIYRNFSRIPDKRIDMDNIRLFLKMGFIPFGKTIFRNVNRVLPGRVYFFENGVISEKILEIPESKAALYEKSDLRNFRTIFENVLFSGLNENNSTVMYSGGIDSSCIISALLSEKPDFNTISVRFDEKAYDEHDFRKDFLLKKQITHRDIFISAGEYTDLMKEYISSGRNDILTCTQDIWAFTAALKKAEIEYQDLYFGLGGDEFFSGYSYMTDVFSDFSDLKELFDINLIDSGRFKGLSEILVKDLLKRISDHFSYIPEYFSEDEILRLTGEKPLIPVSHTDRKDEDSFFKSMVLFQYYNELPGNQYPRLNSIETLSNNYIKVPLGSTDLLQYSISAGYKCGIDKNISKITLYNAYRDIIPENILKRKKQGFRIPLLEWIRQGHFDFMKEIILFKLDFLDIDKKFLDKLFKLENPVSDKEKIWLLINLSIIIP